MDKTLDYIEILGLRMMLYCGVLPEEEQRRQPFEIDLRLYSDLSSINPDSDLEDTVDYGAVIKAIEESLTTKKFLLVEVLADHICSLVLNKFQVGRITVKVKKMAAPLESHVDNVAVSLTRP